MSVTFITFGTGKDAGHWLFCPGATAAACFEEQLAVAVPLAVRAPPTMLSRLACRPRDQSVETIATAVYIRRAPLLSIERHTWLGFI